MNVNCAVIINMFIICHLLDHNPGLSGIKAVYLSSDNKMQYANLIDNIEFI